MNEEGMDASDLMAFITTIGLEILGLISFIIDESFSFIPDFLGLVFLGGWRKMKRKKSKKFWFAFLGELTPYLGAFFFWLLYLVSDLKSKHEKS
ncbi:MAG: hypothetical protein LR000_02180 [Candidatus Pacebacteria bacterium]|nr:hypothetical protein [Candidatus Paceibacterota bacterium]